MSDLAFFSVIERIGDLDAPKGIAFCTKQGTGSRSLIWNRAITNFSVTET